VIAEADEILTTDGFARAYEELLRRERRIWPARSWHPSGIGHPCDRYLVWRWTRHEEQQVHTTTLQAIFGEGAVHQPHVYQRLEQLGFEVVREQDRPRQWEPRPGVVISGRIDGRIIGYRGVRYDPARILEIKTASDYSWQALHTIEDVRASEHHYIRAYWAQGQLYCLLENLPQGVIVLKSKQTGLLKLLPYELDYGYSEHLVQRLERLTPMVLAKQDPPPIPYAREVCGDCGFNHICYPPRVGGEGTKVIEDAALLVELERLERLGDDAKEYQHAEKWVKDRVKGLLRDGDDALCGPWLLTVRGVTKRMSAHEAHERLERHVKFYRVE
jgi:CRISPR/Cas system-associated exonuclease Cas4 (RecB family)